MGQCWIIVLSDGLMVTCVYLATVISLNEWDIRATSLRSKYERCSVLDRDRPNVKNVSYNNSWFPALFEINCVLTISQLNPRGERSTLLQTTFSRQLMPWWVTCRSVIIIGSSMNCLSTALIFAFKSTSYETFGLSDAVEWVMKYC